MSSSGIKIKQEPGAPIELTGNDEMRNMTKKEVQALIGDTTPTNINRNPPKIPKKAAKEIADLLSFGVSADSSSGSKRRLSTLSNVSNDEQLREFLKDVDFDDLPETGSDETGSKKDDSNDDELREFLKGLFNSPKKQKKDVPKLTPKEVEAIIQKIHNTVDDNFEKKKKEAEEYKKESTDKGFPGIKLALQERLSDVIKRLNIVKGKNKELVPLITNEIEFLKALTFSRDSAKYVNMCSILASSRNITSSRYLEKVIEFMKDKKKELGLNNKFGSRRRRRSRGSRGSRRSQRSRRSRRSRRSQRKRRRSHKK